MGQHPRRAWYWLRGETGAGNALAGARQNAGLTQAQLATQVGMDRTTLITMEAGRNAAVNRLLRAFNRMGYDLIAVPRTARVSVDLYPEKEEP